MQTTLRHFRQIEEFLRSSQVSNWTAEEAIVEDLTLAWAIWQSGLARRMLLSFGSRGA